MLEFDSDAQIMRRVKMAKATEQTKPEEPKTVDVEYALSALRSENARLREAAKVNAAREAQNREISQKNREHTQNRILELQDQLLASQDKVCDLQKRLLTVRALVNEG
jgi:hypothetical protein